VKRIPTVKVIYLSHDNTVWDLGPDHSNLLLICPKAFNEHLKEDTWISGEWQRCHQDW